jgi:phosphoribosylformylglycinamidine cyclo-ligase
MSSLSYEQSGVNYDRLDAFKRACQRAAATTTPALALHGFSEPARVRGESAYLIETLDGYLAHVEEGLGTKNLVADAMWKLTGRSFYRNIGIDTVATMVNDLITCGALPISIAMHAAVGDSEWFASTQLAEDLAAGFAHACHESNAVWGGGETPALKGIVNPETIVLAGSAVGQIKPKSHRIMGNVQEGDAIVLLASTGVQTNGLTLCRALALDPSAIYVKFVAACQDAGVGLHYAAHVTGHGWRKLMRLDEPFVYYIKEVREPLPIFRFIMEHGPVEEREAYATFNMGAGFAVYIDPGDLPAVMRLAGSLRYDAWHAGTVEKQGDRKAVEIAPLGITFEGDTLQVR